MFRPNSRPGRSRALIDNPMEIPYTVKPRPDTGLYNGKVGIWLFLASEVMLFGAFFSAYVLLRVGAGPGEWPQGLLNVPLGFINTLVLIASSVTVVMAWASLKMGNFKKFRMFQGITVLCALFFLVAKTFEYESKFKHYDVRLADGTRMMGHIEGNPYFWNTATLREREIQEFLFHPDPILEAGGKVHPESVTIQAADVRRLTAQVPAHSTYFAIYFTMTGLHALHVFGGALVMAYFWGPGSRMWFTEPERLTNRIEITGLFWHFVDLVWIFLFPILYLL
jgi:cytochrome c oxidase subunit III